MADVDGALAREAAEDGGVRFECRPRGAPRGTGRLLLLVALLGPFWSGAWDVAAAWVRWRDHQPTWSVYPDEVVLGVHYRPHGYLYTFARLPGWGFESPLVPGLVVPWLLVGTLGIAAVEVVRFARHRSRRIAVTRARLLLGVGLVAPRVRAYSLAGAPRLQVTRGRVTVVGLTRPVPLGPLDDLDLAELASVLGAPPPETVAPPSSGRRRRLLAAGVALALCGLVVRVAPWRSTLSVRRSAGRDADVVTLDLDVPAWGPLRAPVPLDDVRAESGRWAHAVREPGGGPTELVGAVGLTLTKVSAAGEEDCELLYHPRDGANGPLRRSEGWWVRVLRSGHFLAALPEGAQVRVLGLVRVAEGDPVPFDVTLAPGDSVTLDLAELRR